MSQVRFPFAAAADPPPSISVAFLVDSCGLSTDSAAAAIKNLSASRRKTARNPGAALELFRSRGFSGSQIARIAAVKPYVFFLDPERKLRPKMDCLLAEGFSQSDIARIVTTFPGVLLRRFEKTLEPSFDFLSTILPSKPLIVAAVMCSPWLLQCDPKKTMLPNAETLRAAGVLEERISQLIKLDAMVMARAPRRFGEYMEMLKGIGFSPKSFKYILALCSLNRISRATLQEKLSSFRKFGFTEEDFFSVFRGAPTVLGLSSRNIKMTIDPFKGFGLRDDEIPSFFGKKAPCLFVLSEQNIANRMDFLVRTLNCKPRDVLSCPALLWYSLERRLIPRAFVRTALLSKGLLRRDKHHYGIFAITEDSFLDNYVIKFQNEIPRLLEEYEKLKAKGVRSSVSVETSS